MSFAAIMTIIMRIRILPCNKAYAPDACLWLTVEDMTAYKQVENELLFYKQHDTLTRLYNRSFFDQASQIYDQP